MVLRFVVTHYRCRVCHLVSGLHEIQILGCCGGYHGQSEAEAVGKCAHVFEIFVELPRICPGRIKIAASHLRVEVTKEVGVRQSLGKHYRFRDQRKPDAHNRLIDNLCNLPGAHFSHAREYGRPPDLEVLPHRQDRASLSAGA